MKRKPDEASQRERARIERAARFEWHDDDISFVADRTTTKALPGKRTRRKSAKPKKRLRPGVPAVK